MGKPRPRWPDEYYPLLRKEANFGCAVCGKPIPLRIHHVEGWDGDPKNPEIPEKLIMLCDDIHHPEADNGKISKSALYELKKNPFNSKRVNHKFQVSNSQYSIISLGSNVFINTLIPLRIYGESIVSVKIENNIILFSAKFYDEHNNLKLEIIDNVWDADTDIADIRYSENTNGEDSHLSIKITNSEPYLDLIVKNGKIHIKGKFYAEGQIFDVNDKGVFVLNKQQLTMHGNVFEGCMTGIDITKNGVGIG